MKKEEFISFCTNNKKKLVVGGTVLVLLVSCGVGIYVENNKYDKIAMEYKDEVDYLKYVKGIKNLTAKKGTKKVDYLKGVTFDKKYIDKVIVDDSKVDLNKEGNYSLKYKVYVKGFENKDVSKIVILTVNSNGVSKEDENKVNKETKDVKENSSNSSTKDYVVSNKENSTNNHNKKQSKPSNNKVSHTHHWQERYKTVNHKEKGHYENRVVKEAWVEEEPIYDMIEKAFCNMCNKDITEDILNDNFSHLENHIKNEGTNKGYRFEYVKEQVGTNKINHPAEYKKVWVVDTPAWSEKIPDGYQCFCGVRK